MGTMINRRRVCGGKSLPYDAEIEYLENNGTQWIDTGIIGTNSLDWEISAKMTGNVMYQHVFGDRYSDNERRLQLTLSTIGYVFFVNGSNTEKSVKYSLESVLNWSTYKKEGNNIYINNVLKGTLSSNSFTTPNTLTLFICRNNGELQYNASFTGQLGHCIIKDNTDFLCDLIPVRKGNVGYMYDKVSGQLFGNAGTGDFILGPDK